MKTLMSILFSVPLAVSAAGVSVTNELLTVDQNNNPSVPGVLGTISDLARLEARTEINEASARAAEQTYDQATNLLDSVAKQLGSSRPVVYRRFFLDSFTAVVVLDPAVDKVVIYGWDKLPDSEQNQPGRQKWYCYFGCTADISTLTPQIKTTNDLSVPKSSWAFLADQYVTGFTPMSGSYTDRDGNTMNNLYRLTVSIPEEQARFVIVYIDADSGEGTGATMLAVGGINGCTSTNVISGSLRFEITGGLWTGVTNVE